MTSSRDSSERRRLVSKSPYQKLDTVSIPLARTPVVWQGAWWLLTVVICASIIWTVRAYEQDGNISTVQKHIFNVISTGLILALGLNFFVSRAHNAPLGHTKDLLAYYMLGGLQIIR